MDIDKHIDKNCDEKIYRPGEAWETFPPNPSDEMRILKYEHYKKLFQCRHIEVFKKAHDWVKANPEEGKRLYIAVNFPRLISTLIADLLFGEPFRIDVPDNLRAQDELREMSTRTTLRGNLYESALSGSYRGSAVLKAKWTAGKGSSITSVPNQYYFPHPDPDDLRTLLGETIAWTRKEGDKTYLRREIHTPGHVHQELWLMEGNTPKTQEPLSLLNIAVPEDLDTGCPGTLVQYVPNMRLDDELWGESDYDPIEALLEALNDRLSRLHRVLNVHSEPIFVGPPGLLTKVKSERDAYEYDKEDRSAIEAPDKDTAEIVRYVTWDAHLSAAFSEIDKILDMIMVCAEVSPDMFGMGKNGFAESGRALKMRWARQLAKRQRREMAYDSALRELLKCAAILDNKFGSGPSIGDNDTINILWGDGLPNDPRDLAEEESLLLAAGISSKKSSYMRVMQAEDEGAEREMEQIAKEKREDIALFSSSVPDEHDHDDSGGNADNDDAE
jgi:hypothetical protein